MAIKMKCGIELLWNGFVKEFHGDGSQKVDLAHVFHFSLSANWVQLIAVVACRETCRNSDLKWIVCVRWAHSLVTGYNMIAFDEHFCQKFSWHLGLTSCGANLLSACSVFWKRAFDMGARTQEKIGNQTKSSIMVPNSTQDTASIDTSFDASWCPTSDATCQQYLRIILMAPPSIESTIDCSMVDSVVRA